MEVRSHTRTPSRQAHTFPSARWFSCLCLRRLDLSWQLHHTPISASPARTSSPPAHSRLSDHAPCPTLFSSPHRPIYRRSASGLRSPRLLRTTSSTIRLSSPCSRCSSSARGCVWCVNYWCCRSRDHRQLARGQNESARPDSLCLLTRQRSMRSDQIGPGAASGGTRVPPFPVKTHRSDPALAPSFSPKAASSNPLCSCSLLPPQIMELCPGGTLLSHVQNAVRARAKPRYRAERKQFRPRSVLKSVFSLQLPVAPADADD